MSNFKNKFIVLASSLAIILTSYTSTVSADAFEGLSMMRMGAWEVDFSGNANSFLVDGECDPSIEGTAVAGGLACGSLTGEDYDFSDIRTGFLPSWFNFSASTQAPGGWKTGIHVSFQPGSDNGPTGLNGSSIGGPLGLNTSNFRQVFVTMTHADYGSLKIGRDLGVFGSNAILEDQTLLGMGATARDLAAGGNSTLGRIGTGYIYADWKSQVQYTTPNMGGLSATFAVVDPWGASSIANLASGGNVYSSTHGNREQDGDTLGFEAKVNYAFDLGDFSGHVWASYIQQDIDWKGDCLDGDTVIAAGQQGAGMCGAGSIIGTNYVSNNDADADGYDIGGKLVMGDIDVVAYFYDGEGIGTSTFLTDGIDLIGEERDSDGYFYQARWRTPLGTLLAASYGESELDLTDFDEANFGSIGNLVETNEMFVIGAYHPIGEGLNLVIEYSQVESEAHVGHDSEEDSLAIGAIMFF